MIHVDPRFKPHVGDGRHLGAAPRRQRPRLPRRADQLRRSQNGRDFRDYVVPYTNAATIIREDFKDTEDLGGLFSGWDEEQHKYVTDSWLYAGDGRQRRRRARRRRARRTACGKEPRRPAAPDLIDAQRDPTLQHPRCVYPAAEAALRALHAGARRAVCGMPQEQFLRGRRRLHVSARARRRPAPSAMPSAGRSTRPACRSSAPRPSCSCCSATSDGPAAASWRCAATRRSRARPTSRRSTTSCPAICRCRTSSRARTRCTTTSSRTARRPAGGTTSTSTSSAC